MDGAFDSIEVDAALKLYRKFREWDNLTDDELRLRAGELTTDEVLVIRAVFNALRPPPHTPVTPLTPLTHTR